MTKPITIRISDKILEPIKEHSRLTGIPYQTIINFTLAKHIHEILRENSRLQKQEA